MPAAAQPDNTANADLRPRAARPNVVFILADDMGWGDLGCYGNPDVETPHLDRLAAEGVRLTAHYSGSPMCAPARAALLTGRYPHRTGAVDVVECLGYDRLALSEVTIADVFRSAGYATGMVGKWHNGAVDPRHHPNARGFDEFIGFRGGFVPSYWDCVLEHDGKSFRSGGRYLTDLFTDEAVAFIERRAAEPFFLYVAYNAPHTPLEAPDEDVRVFAETGKFTEAVSTIYAMNRCLDAGVGLILDALDRLGLAENTMVVFTSDNGPMFCGEGQRDTHRWNGPWSGAKGDVLEGGIRVPALVRWPAALPAGLAAEGVSHFTDWLPTLAGAAGVPLPRHLDLDGRDAIPVLRGDEASGVAPRFWQWNRYDPARACNAAVRDGDWKLHVPPIPEAMAKRPEDNERSRALMADPTSVERIWRDPVHRKLSDPRKAELFHLKEDPGERNDLSEAQAERATEMRRQLDEWMEKMLSEWPGVQD